MPLGEKMNRKFVLIMIATAGLFAGGAAALAQNRPYDQVMKDIGAAFNSLEENLEPDEESAEAALDEESAEAALDEESAEAAVEDAAKLEGLFEEVEAFWAPFNAQYALDLARDAREAAAAVGAAVRGNDIEMAQEGYAAMQTSCTNCHYSHRVVTDSGFLIKP